MADGLLLYAVNSQSTKKGAGDGSEIPTKSLIATSQHIAESVGMTSNSQHTHHNKVITEVEEQVVKR